MKMQVGVGSFKFVYIIGFVVVWSGVEWHATYKTNKLAGSRRASHAINDVDVLILRHISHYL
jgi:hypothetical protein